MSLQLARRSIKYLVGILKDIPIRIDQLYIPTDFVIMEMEENSQILIILGRIFLDITSVIIDIQKRKHHL